MDLHLSNELDNARVMKRDWAGRLNFENVRDALEMGFRVVSLYRKTDGTYPEYEVVLTSKGRD